MTGVLDELTSLMADRGRESYGEAVTIAEHMLLTAAAAEARDADDAMVAACLFHDVGHLLGEPDDAYGIHDHGGLGGDWVEERFGPEVAGPVRLHIDAKRFLCARDPGYRDRLSDASRYTLAKQGGPMTETEAAVFETHPHADAAVQLRRWEDSHGKRGDVTVPLLAHFAPLLDRLGAGGVGGERVSSGGRRRRRSGRWARRRRRAGRPRPGRW